MINKKQKKFKIFCIYSFFSICAIFSAAMLYQNSEFENKFSSGTTINQIDVGGLNQKETMQKLSNFYIQKAKNLSVQVEHDNKVYVLENKELNICDDLSYYIKDAISKNDNSIFRRRADNFTISAENIYTNIDDFVLGIENDVNYISTDASFYFAKNASTPFELTNSQKGKIVEREKLLECINKNITCTDSTIISLPTKSIEPFVSNKDIEEKISRLSFFSTSYKTSTADRKHNIKTALDCFNGIVLLPNEQISFNETTGSRTTENNYKTGKIIMDGKFVDGIGGGVCQASTTLYNAALLAGLQIDCVFPHSLTVGYVPLGFDAMVNEGYADLMFTNTTTSPLYIVTNCTNNDASVTFYGQKTDKTYKLKNELVDVLPNSGDNILSDTNNVYSKEITFKGEYFRAKYPKCGYVINSYVLVFHNNELLEKNLIKTTTYPPQNGLIYEGTEDPWSGITIPKSNVKVMEQQNKSDINFEAEKAKLIRQNKLTK